jgi:hypothetical protein
LPYSAQTDFIPFIWFGDAEADVTIDDAASCDGQMAPDATTISGCRVWDYTAVTGAFAGVSWSYPLNDFAGTSPGICVSESASEVEFYAKGEVGGEVIGLAAGGTPTVDIVLTTTWTRYTVALPATVNSVSPGGVKTGFVWAAAAASNPTGARFYLSNITWIQ